MRREADEKGARKSWDGTHIGKPLMKKKVINRGSTLDAVQETRRKGGQWVGGRAAVGGGEAVNHPRPPSSHLQGFPV